MSTPSFAFRGLFDRRTLLRAGAVGTVGLSLPELLAAESRSAPSKERSCILIFAWGGPHHLDTFDPKPDAPAEVRGPYGTTATRVPGMRLVDQFPRLAQQAKRFSLVRSISHAVGDHNAAAYVALTGRTPPPVATALMPETPADFPCLGSVLSRVRPTDGAMPSYVLAPVVNHNLKVTTPGQRAGFLGERHNPFVATHGAKSKDFEVPALALPQGVDASRLAVRQALRDGLERQRTLLEQSLMARKLGENYEKAFNLINSPQARQAFTIRQEPAATRERYGQHRLGQSLLLARRLIEAGVRIVVVNDADERGDAFRWDTHNDKNVAPALRRNLPGTDVAVSALLDDLHERGMLESTLVVWMGEMGRTPKGRTGHWTRCYPALLAGAGIQGGRVHGESDAIGAYPKSGRCGPADIHATIYHALGIPADTHLTDAVGRPIPLYAGDPISTLF
jgi:uncharacterized protein (DUF1501 family)